MCGPTSQLRDGQGRDLRRVTDRDAFGDEGRTGTRSETRDRARRVLIRGEDGGDVGGEDMAIPLADVEYWGHFLVLRYRERKRWTLEY